MLPSLARLSLRPLSALRTMKITPVQGELPISRFRTGLTSLTFRGVSLRPARSDNWMYLISDPATNEAAVVDPYNASGMQKEVEKQGVKVRPSPHLVLSSALEG